MGSADPSIFVSIPSYRDPECQYTIRDLFSKALKPERVFIGVCWQADPEEDAACFLLEPPSHLASNVRVLPLHHRDARGPCYARARIQQELYQDEEYYFQLDSHYRMIPNWDEELLSQLDLCRKQSARPILSTYPSSYTLPEDYQPGEEDRAKLHPAKDPIVLCAKGFGADGFLRITGKSCKASAFDVPQPGIFWAAGFSFSSAAMLREVPYDVELEDLFFGEEPSMATRLWTSGFDFFAPTKVIGYHLWTRKHRPVFREHGSEEQRRREMESQQRVRQLLRGDADVPGGGLGSRRPLAEYEELAGLSFANRTLSVRARRGGFAPAVFCDGDPASTVNASAASKGYGAPGGGLPTNVALQIQALLGQGPAAPAAAAPALVVPTLPLQPPRLLHCRGGEPQLLRPMEVELLNSQGFLFMDRFLQERCYGPFCSQCQLEPAEALGAVRRGLAKARLRPARLGRGESVWSSTAVRGDEMTWLSSPKAADVSGLWRHGQRALQRRAGRSQEPGRKDAGHVAKAATGATSATEYDSITANLQSMFAKKEPRADERGDFHATGEDAVLAADEQDPECYEELDVLLVAIAALRCELDEAFGFGCRRVSTMVARYPGAGARYARHRDALPNHDVRRRLTAVYYANDGWREEDGGCLRAHFPAEVGRHVEGARPNDGSEEGKEAMGL
ncbi:gnt1 [Symbiodinium sp. CCMP2592]|nr:gnt1 [Symbiodinium sp. CCMP2592]